MFDDLRLIEEEFLSRFSEIEEMTDALYLYEDIAERFMESWGTWKPYYPIRLYETASSWRFQKLFYNNNFFDDSHEVMAVPGYGSYGFTCSFNHPWEDKIIKVDFDHYEGCEFKYSFINERRKLLKKDYKFE